MTNREALKAQCKLICNTCYVDNDVVEYSLLSAGIEAERETENGSPDLIRLAIEIVRGWVETSRSENGITASVDMPSVRNNIIYWCGKAGLDASDYIDDLVAFENGSDLW